MAERSGLPPDGDDSHLREERLESESVWRGRMLDVRVDQVRLPDGSTTRREYIVHPGAVVVVGLLDDGRVVVERQWRYPVGRAMIEFPAGKLDPGEPVLDCAIRELIEETGYRAREWARAGILHNAIGYSNEGIEVWFARGLEAGERQLDDGEFLDVYDASLDELESLAQRGELTDAKTLVAMLWLHQWRDGRWPLEWRPAPA
ncbi:NUDIX domain-containing protein [Piscinibacter koreensis]|uniref:GDP-mannose pyrophosphatase n=1 Tax=Piscinibacter koreensis TaxID=2742824 RepID=A0A7Y6NRT1_9BURK|nr:NUDIX hydrolase [Schlegelella koreensis]NUZ08144.1 NUDIX hydrolase [Schlegelella koreensis]